jgi:phenylacetic acid degradation operon negative regulatory protein
LDALCADTSGCRRPNSDISRDDRHEKYPRWSNSEILARFRVTEGLQSTNPFWQDSIVKPRTKLLLYELAWMMTCIARPTYGNLSCSFEGWARREGLLRHIHRLEADDFLRMQGRSLDRVIVLTEKGRNILVSERNPERAWAQPWDGLWRLVLFDVPEERRRLRHDLRKTLKAEHFGLLQKSVWVSPHPISESAKFLRSNSGGSRTLTIMESRLSPFSESAEIARLAWKFDEINEGYRSYLDFLDNWKRQAATDWSPVRLKDELRIWESALSADPLLPAALLPSDYLGRKALARRNREIPRLLKRDLPI